MVNNKTNSSAMILAWVLLSRAAFGQEGPTTALYQIVSGHYIVCCGIAGPFDSSLPNDQQAFVKLTVDRQRGFAQMTFLGQDMHTVPRISLNGTGGGLSFTLTNGMVFPDHIEFGKPSLPTAPGQLYWGYTVSNSANALRIDGVVIAPCIGCADIPTEFTHTNVVAVLMTAAMIRVSEIEVYWNAVSNLTYQVQYRSTLTTNAWIDLGSPLPGNNSTNSIMEKVLLGQPQRFYRVLMVP